MRSLSVSRDSLVHLTVGGSGICCLLFANCCLLLLITLSSIAANDYPTPETRYPTPGTNDRRRDRRSLPPAHPLRVVRTVCGRSNSRRARQRYLLLDARGKAFHRLQ